MDRNETIKHLQEKYPEDLNDNYNCYWWYTCDLDENGLKYHYYYVIRQQGQMKNH